MSKTNFERLFRMITDGDFEPVFYEKGLKDEDYFKLQKLSGEILKIYD